MVTFLFYHKADLDGYLSGYLLKRYILNENKKDNKCTYVSDDKVDLSVIQEYIKNTGSGVNNVIYSIPYNYDDYIDIDKIEQVLNMVGVYDVKVYFVDCSPHQKNGYFEKLYSILKGNLIIIDHHTTAIEYIKNFENENGRERIISGLRMLQYSGCELTTIYISMCSKCISTCGNGEEIDRFYKELPDFIKLLGRYDVYDVDCKDYNWGSEIIPFQYGFRTHVKDLTDIININDTIEKLLIFNKSNQIFSLEQVKEMVNVICTEGFAVLNYIKNRNKTLLKDNGCKSEVCFIYNSFREDEIKINKKAYWASDHSNNSLIFGDDYCNPDVLYLLIGHNLRSNKYKISLYSVPHSEIDVSKIAKCMGGGGHKHAAGFTSSHVSYKDGTLYITKTQIEYQIEDVIGWKEVFKKRGELFDILIKNDYGNISREECEVRKNEIKREIIDLSNEEVDLREVLNSMRDPDFSWEDNGKKKSDYDVGHEKLKIEKVMNETFLYINNLHKNNDVEGLKAVKRYIDIIHH
jgi:hypothetical protein